ncbi:MAG: hypothetical protein Q4D81_11510, partial [Eubacteriales bacterium]|nr:hypothetical protein [Eubacteriales bacterium]
MGEIIKELHKYLCWLDQIPEIGRKARFSLLQVAAAQNLFSDGIETGESLASGARVLYDASERQLTWLCGEAFPAGEKARKMVQLLTRAKNREPARVEEELFHAEIRFSCILEEDFPRRLRRIPDPPFGIYAKGRLPEQEPVRDIRDRESPIRPDPETVCPAGEGGNGDGLRGPAGEGRNGDGMFGPAG